MKKVCICLLAVLLLCMGTALSESEHPYVPLEDQGNLLLDIPWGISVDELQSLAKEKTGFDIFAGEKIDGLTTYYRTPEVDGLTFLGEPCLSFRFIVNGVPENAVGEFFRVAIVEYPALEYISGDQVVQETEELMQTYSEHYGPRHHTHIQVGTGIEGSRIFFDFPCDENGNIHQDALLFAACELGVINIISCYENISLTSDIYYIPELNLYAFNSFALFAQPTEENTQPEFHELDSLGNFEDFYKTHIKPAE